MSFLNEDGPCPSFLKVHTFSQWFEVCDNREPKGSDMKWSCIQMNSWLYLIMLRHRHMLLKDEIRQFESAFDRYGWL